MRNVIASLLISTFVLGALAWSMDIHVHAIMGDPAVTVDQAAEYTSDPAGGNGHLDHCGHCSAHFTGLPIASLAGAIRPTQPVWPLVSVAHASLIHTPPTPPPSR